MTPNTRRDNPMIDAQHLADRYVAVWNENDAEKRRQAIAALWTPDGVHYMDTREARGYDALEQRVTGSYEKNVRDRGNRFRAAKGAHALRDVVTFFWDMIPAHGDTALASGLAVLIVDHEGRIRTDYLFVLESIPASAAAA
jgi:hypothetical protein